MSFLEKIQYAFWTFFLLFFSAALASLLSLTVIGIFFSNHHHFSSFLDHIRIQIGVSLWGPIFASPALLLFAYPSCLLLQSSNNKNVFIWVGTLTGIAFLYSLPWWFFSRDNDVRWIYLFTGTGFLTSVIVWFLINYARMPKQGQLIFIFSVIALLYWSSLPKPLSETQKQNAERIRLEKAHIEKVKSGPLCKDWEIEVVINGVPLLVPRELKKLRFSSSLKNLNEELLPYLCDIKRIEEVSVASINNNLTISDSPVTFFSTHLEDIVKAKQEARIKELDDGLQIITMPGSVWYLLPESAATANGEPVLLICNSSEKCRTQYRTPEGVTLYYAENIKLFINLGFVEADRRLRNNIKKSF